MPLDLSDLIFKAFLLYPLHEHQLGEVSELGVELTANTVSCQDNGRGMGLDRQVQGIAYVDLVFGQLSEELQMTEGFSIQLQGVGLSLIRSLAKQVEITSYRKGQIYQYTLLKEGHLGQLKSLGETPLRGTQIKMSFDKSPVFQGFSLAQAEAYLTEIKTQFPQLKLKLNSQLICN